MGTDFARTLTTAECVGCQGGAILSAESNKDNPPPRWYAVYTRHRHEWRVQEELAGKGIETFLPSRDLLHHWKGRRRIVAIPLFNGYIFVHVQMQERRIDILRTRGLVRIVGFNSTPEPVPDCEIEAVRRFLDTTIKYDPYPYVVVGQEVIVRRGPLEGVQGILVRKKSRFKFVLSVHLLRQSVALEIDASEVEPVLRANSRPTAVANARLPS